MAEQSETSKYIKCSKCRCKCHNNDDHIKTGFGYNRLGEQFKCCVTCRARNREYTRTYYEKNKDAINADKRADIKVSEYMKKYQTEHRDGINTRRRDTARKHGMLNVRTDIDVAQGASKPRRLITLVNTQSK